MTADTLDDGYWNLVLIATLIAFIWLSFFVIQPVP